MILKRALTLLTVVFTAILLVGSVTTKALPTEVLPSSYSFIPVDGQTGWFDGYIDGEPYNGPYTYGDPSFSKLTDGIYGDDDWTINPERWVGWWGIEYAPDGDDDPYEQEDYITRDIELTFHFTPGTIISSIIIGTNQDAIYNWNVVLSSYLNASFDGNTLFTRQIPFDKSNSGIDDGNNKGKRHSLTFVFDPIKITDINNSINISLNNEYNFNNYQTLDPDIPWDNSPGSSHNGMFWIFLDEVDFYSQPVPEPSTILLFISGLFCIMIYATVRRYSLRFL